MTTYMDPELAETLAIACRGLLDIEKKFEGVKRADLREESGEGVHEAHTAGLILYASTEPFAVVRMEDTWSEADLLTEDEKDLVEVVAKVLANVNHYKVVDGNIVRKSEEDFQRV